MNKKTTVSVLITIAALGFCVSATYAWPWTTHRNVYGFVKIKGSQFSTMDKFVTKVVVTGDNNFKGEYKPNTLGQTTTIRWFVNNLPIEKNYTATAYTEGMLGTNKKQKSVTFKVTKPVFGDDQGVPDIEINY